MGVLLSTLIPDDVAVVYGLSPLAATFFIRFFTAWDVSFLLFAAPLLSLALLWGAGGVGAEETEQLSPLPDFPIWRLAVFLFCFYAANGFLISLIPILFPMEFARADQVTDWIRALSSLGVAFIFRFYPRADLRNFYRGAFPFIAAALFFLTFSPYRTPARFFLEGGLSFLDLYAGSPDLFCLPHGPQAGAVINFGIFIIVFAGTWPITTCSSGAPPSPRSVRSPSFALLGYSCCFSCFPVGREGTAPPDGKRSPKEREEEGFAGGDDGGDMGDADPEVKEKEEEMGRRMKLMEFNLTDRRRKSPSFFSRSQRPEYLFPSLISQNTLKYHLRNIYRKTGSSNRRELKNILD